MSLSSNNKKSLKILITNISLYMYNKRINYIGCKYTRYYTFKYMYKQWTPVLCLVHFHTSNYAKKINNAKYSLTLKLTKSAGVM